MLIVFIVYAPTNSGLSFVREKGIEQIPSIVKKDWKVISVRGEDIPNLVRERRGSYGITGDDIFQNYLLERKNRQGEVEVIQRLNLKGLGPYNNFLFGLPTLCLLGPDGKLPEEYDESTQVIPNLDSKTVVIPGRYKELISECLIPSNNVNYVTLDGKVDVTAAVQGCYAVDIVGTGRTCKGVGMGVVAKLYESDGVILGQRGDSK